MTFITPEGAIREAEELAAELYGSDRCWFLVNGTTLPAKPQGYDSLPPAGPERKDHGSPANAP